MSVTRDDLVKVAMNSGLSYRMSRKVVSTMIKEMVAALNRGEDLDLPFVLIHPVKNKRQRRLWAFKKIAVHNKKYRFMTRQKKPWI